MMKYLTLFLAVTLFQSFTAAIGTSPEDNDIQMKTLLAKARMGIEFKSLTITWENKRLFLKKKNLETQTDRPSQSVALIHLKQILGEDYKPTLTISENIENNILNNTIFSNLYSDLLSHRIYLSVEEREQKINWIANQLSCMVSAEEKHKTHAVYFACSSGISAYYDLLNQLRSTLALKPCKLPLRLNDHKLGGYESATVFLKKFCEENGIDDDQATGDANPEFRAKGLCASISPFQDRSCESAAHFWLNNTTQSRFDAFTTISQEFKLSEEENKMLAPLFQKLRQLSALRGGRMYQIFMPVEALERYTWASQAFGLPRQVIKRDTNKTLRTTYHDIAGTLNEYTSHPKEFVRGLMHLNLHPDREVGMEFPSELFSKNLSSPSKEDIGMLADFQVRIYLGPDLVWLDSLDVNSYFTKLVDSAWEKDYNLTRVAFNIFD